MDIMSLIVGLILIGLAIWVVRTLSGALGIPAPIVTVLHVLIVVFAVFWILSAFGLWSGGPTLRMR